MNDKQWVTITIDDEDKDISFDLDVFVKVAGDFDEGYSVEIIGDMMIGDSYISNQKLEDKVSKYIGDNLGGKFEYLISESPQG